MLAGCVGRAHIWRPILLGDLMNYIRLALAAVAAFVAYMGVGSVFFTVRGMRAEFERHTAVYRTGEAMNRVMVPGMLGMLLAMGAAAALFAMAHPTGAGWVAGARFGCIVGVFVLGTYVLHNYMILNISGRLATLQGLAHFIQWVGVGAVIALLYRP